MDIFPIPSGQDLHLNGRRSVEAIGRPGSRQVRPLMDFQNKRSGHAKRK